MENFNILPINIKLEILKWLPSESYFTCRLVCKDWKKIVYHPLVDYVEETQVELEDMSKELSIWPGEGNVDVKKFQIIFRLAKKEVLKVTEESVGVTVGSASDAADANLIKAVRYTSVGKRSYDFIVWHTQSPSFFSWGYESPEE